MRGIDRIPARAGGAAACLLLVAAPGAAAPGFVPVEPLDGATFESHVTDLSDDGLFAVGWSDGSEGVRATRWTAAQGSISLGVWFMPQPNDRRSEAQAISGDGSTVVGWSRVDASGAPQFPDRRIAFHWTEAGGFEVFPLSAGVEAVAVDVSSDGATIVGFQRSSTTASFSVRFVEGASPVSIGIPCCNPFVTSLAAAVNADGSTLAGWGDPPGGEQALLWRSGPGFERLSDVATTELGLDLTGWTLTRANSITPDGNAIVGDGTNPQGVPQGWILYFEAPASGEPVPLLGGPGLVLLALLLAALGSPLRAGRLRVPDGRAGCRGAREGA